MKRLLIFSWLLSSALLPSLCLAKDLSSTHMIGIRFGFWNAVKAQNIKGAPDQEITSKVSGPYGEFFITSGMKKGFALEFSFGSYSRGETRYSDSAGYYWKQVTIYPISAELKFYPFSPIKKSRWQPYMDAGIAFVSGIEDLRLGEYAGSLLFMESGTNTYTTLGWHAGGGMEFVLSRLFVIGADFKYRGVNFKEDVGGLKDYSGPQATLGLSYILKGI